MWYTSTLWCKCSIWSSGMAWYDTCWFCDVNVAYVAELCLLNVKTVISIQCWYITAKVASYAGRRKKMWWWWYKYRHPFFCNDLCLISLLVTYASFIWLWSYAWSSFVRSRQILPILWRYMKFYPVAGWRKVRCIFFRLYPLYKSRILMEGGCGCGFDCLVH